MRVGMYSIGRYDCVRLEMVDLLTYGYLGVVGLLWLALADRAAYWWVHLFAHAGIMFAALEAIRASTLYPKSRSLAVARLLYPAVVIVYGFLEIGQIQEFFTEPWATPWIAGWDLALFGTHPTVWFKQFFTPWVDEFMCFFRVSYYVTGLLVLLPLLIADRRDDVLTAGGIVNLHLHPQLHPVLPDSRCEPAHGSGDRLPGYHRVHRVLDREH